MDDYSREARMGAFRKPRFAWTGDGHKRYFSFEALPRPALRCMIHFVDRTELSGRGMGSIRLAGGLIANKVVHLNRHLAVILSEY